MLRPLRADPVIASERGFPFKMGHFTSFVRALDRSICGRNTVSLVAFSSRSLLPALADPFQTVSVVGENCVTYVTSFWSLITALSGVM
jgi:hypothetical protein